jgi:hypothetical protein
MTNHTISLRQDEEAKIKEWMQKHSLTHHQVLKLAIRLLLFNEKRMPLDGKTAEKGDILAHDPLGRITIVDDRLNIGVE